MFSENYGVTDKSHRRRIHDDHVVILPHPLDECIQPGIQQELRRVWRNRSAGDHKEIVDAGYGNRKLLVFYPPDHMVGDALALVQAQSAQDPGFADIKLEDDRSLARERQHRTHVRTDERLTLTAGRRCDQNDGLVWIRQEIFEVRTYDPELLGDELATGRAHNQCTLVL